MLSRKSAVLFDVGGPLDTEVRLASALSEAICDAFRLKGVDIDQALYENAVQKAVATFAPEDFQAIVWFLANGDATLSSNIWGEISPLLNSGRRAALFTPRDGIEALLATLVRKGIRLGLAANQPASALDALDAAGFGKHFTWRGLSGTVGFRKPDHRLFLAACEGLEIAASECVMVGDRIDLDIGPARQLGMTTVLFRTGSHQGQMPRSWLEVPHYEVTTVAELADLFAAW